MGQRRVLDAADGHSVLPDDRRAHDPCSGARVRRRSRSDRAEPGHVLQPDGIMSERVQRIARFIDQRSHDRLEAERGARDAKLAEPGKRRDECEHESVAHMERNRRDELRRVLRHVESAAASRHRPNNRVVHTRHTC